MKEQPVLPRRRRSLYVDFLERCLLTGLYGHRKINELLRAVIQHADLEGHSVSVLYLDVDDFRPINDQYGYETGDLVLQHVGEQLRLEVRAQDHIGRFGGDEFLIVLPETTAQEAENLAYGIQKRVREQRFFAANYEEALPVTLSIGVAEYPLDARSIKDLIAAAVSAKEHAQHEGIAKLQRRGISYELFVAKSSGALELYLLSLKDKDTYTVQHSEDVADYTMLLATALGLPESMQVELRTAGLFHDIGKVLIPDPILKKPGRLTEEEFVSMKSHVTISHDILAAHYTSEVMRDGVKHHHERYDGRGYPTGLCGEDIPLAGRIVAIADAFSAMTLDRSYRKSKTVDEALAEIRRCAGTQFDPKLSEVFCEEVEKRRTLQP
ncbi:HD-GYP domain-containing protein [Tumebacillus sp. ITR2]|uniref:HD-GYP domain-containing protein n=1 Tax=Tumebacillus amylolyticus TaxID=2801339 RepID=A0ABS1J7E9_9BACL|nr:HD-GYP domain-containing protein [Tumebacillus amylolyticus]MBL0386105.1 HD-GYP domain-containing protein [Tumebacillus amylolyticus]